MIYPEDIQRWIGTHRPLDGALGAHIFPGEVNKTRRVLPEGDFTLEHWLCSEGRGRSTEIRRYLDFLADMKSRFLAIRQSIAYRNPEASHSSGHDEWSTGWAGEGMLPIAAYLYYLKSFGLSGAVLECGVFKGGSTACLSWACEHLGFTLISADSFEGLPAGEGHYGRGDFRGGLDEVRENVSRHGRIGSVEFVKGFYRESLRGFNRDLATIWLDVDLKQSVLDALGNTFDSLLPGGVIFSDGLVREVDYDGDRLKGEHGEPGGLVEFFSSRSLPYKAVPAGPKGLGLIVPRCLDDEHLLYESEKLSLTTGICDRVPAEGGRSRGAFHEGADLAGRVAARSLLVCATPRSGSTLFCRSLEDTGRIGLCREWFQPTEFLGRRRAYGLPPDEAFHTLSRTIVERETSPAGIFSLKIMWETLGYLLQDLRRTDPAAGGMSDYGLLESYFPHPRFILVTRSDKVRQAVSHVKALQSGHWEYDGEKLALDTSLLSFDYLAVEEAVETFRSHESSWRRFFDENGIEAMEIEYESFLAEREKILRDSLNFLDLGVPEDFDLPAGTLLKMSDDINRSWALRFEETGRSASRNGRDPGGLALPSSTRSARISPGEKELSLEAGRRFRLSIRVKNLGDRLWPAVGAPGGRFWILLHCRWRGGPLAEAVLDSARGYLPHDLPPGEEAAVTLIVTAPREPGNYRLELTLLQEGIGPFETEGEAALEATVRLSEEALAAERYFGKPSKVFDDGWKYSPWFGYYDDRRFPWVLHGEHGWLYASGPGAASGEFWFFDPSLGWFHTSPDSYPSVWSDNEGAWLLFDRKSRAPRLFLNMESGRWMPVEPPPSPVPEGGDPGPASDERAPSSPSSSPESADHGIDHSRFTELLGDDIQRKVGATSLNEQAWCEWFCRDVYSGAGAIVELGPWLGSLTSSCCAGLRKNPRARGMRSLLHVYDLFRWDQWCEEFARGTKHEGKLEVGQCFRSYYRGLLGEYEDCLEVHKADLAAEGWNGGPIELIVNDAVKSIDIGRNVFSAFVPSLIPHQGRIAHQDYLWPTEAFLHLFMYLAREFFVLEFAVPDSTMVIFRAVKTLEPSVLQVPSPLSRSDHDLITAAFDWSRSLLGSVDGRHLGLCQAVLMRNAGLTEEARRIVRDSGLLGRLDDPHLSFQVTALREWGYTDLLGD